MRLKRLDLQAFGPFTNRTLEFHSKGPGFHIIFGHNEAGKSSSLRALKALLYGFPQQTPDNFIHSYDQLLVGGCLENNAGEALVFQRRKKRVGDVLDEAGNPIDGGVIAPFLNGIDPEIFASLHGIDHETLVRGGEEILAQKGEVGQALFAAGAGISSLREVIEQLEQEAADLFKPTGQNPAINKALKKFKELQKAAKDATLSAKDWSDHQKALKRALAARQSLEQERDEKNKELHRLERLARAVPELASLQSRREQLRAMGAIVLLEPDFADRYQQIRQEKREAEQSLQKDTEHLARLEERRNAILFNKELLRQAEKVDDFHQRLGEYRKGQKDKPERNGMRISLRKEAARLLQLVRPDLPLEEVETLRPLLARKKTVQAFIAQQEALNQQLAQAKKQSKAARQLCEEVEKALAAFPETTDSQGLLQAVKLALKAGDVDAQLEKHQGDIERSKNEALAELKRRGRWTGDLAALMVLPLPLSETLQQFEKRYNDLADEQRELAKERKNNEKELHGKLIEIKKIAYAGDVPSEEELNTVREKRQQGWRLVCRQWLDQEDVSEESRQYDPAQSLPQAYEHHVEQADRIADRLRREADRVANVAAARAQIEALHEALTENHRKQDACACQEKELHDAWVSVWQLSGITPLSPKEMSSWLAEMDTLRFKVGDLVKKEQEIERHLKQRKELRQAVENELHAMNEEGIPGGEKLAPVVVLAETVLERIAERRKIRDTLQERREKAMINFQQADDDLKTAQEAFIKWQEEWLKVTAGLSGQDAITSLEAVDALENLQQCFDTLKDAEDLKKRINGIDRDAGILHVEVQALIEKVAPSMLSLPLDQAILQLRSMLGQAQKDGNLYDELSKNIDTLQKEISAASNTLQQTKEQMAELLRTAKCDSPEELPAIIDTFHAYVKLREKISDSEVLLAKIGAGVSIEELARQAAEVDVDALPGLISLLKRDIEERINPEISKISEVIGTEGAKLATMDGNANAADIAEEMEQELAKIRRLAERYALVKLSTKILQQEIERYREEHQDPVLKIASTYFAELTQGSFAGLRTDVDDKGEPVLVGVRPNQVRLTVEKMSSGTRDQLFLALRLATLEWRLETSESMPFIVDDILINFDDVRSRATLNVLAKVSTKTQVILFTHHRQIVEEAQKIPDQEVFIHEL